MSKRAKNKFEIVFGLTSILMQGYGGIAKNANNEFTVDRIKHTIWNYFSSLETF